MLFCTQEFLLFFTVVLLASSALLMTTRHVAIRPLLGATVLLPVALITSGLVRAVWALRLRTGIGLRRATLAFANWLSLSWTVALACVQGLVRGKGVFMRTPKSGDRRDPLSAIWTARSETVLAALLWGSAAVLLGEGRATPFLLGLLAWQGAVYATAPFMSLLAGRTRLGPELERRRRTERMRDRFTRAAPYLAGAAATVVAVALIGGLIGLGGSHPGPRARNPFVVPHKATSSVTPSPGGTPSPTVPSTPPSPTLTVSPSSPPTTPSPSPSPSPSPT